MKENVVWCDFEPGETWDFIDGLNEVTNMSFVKEVFVNNKMSTKKDNLLRYLKYITFALSHFLNRKKYKTIVSWQQFYGLFFAFFCKLFHVKKVNKLVIMVFIYIPKKGFLGKIYKFFFSYILSSQYIDKIILNSTSEAKKYSKELNCEESLFTFVPLGENIKKTHEDVSFDSGFLLASGFSNRDFDFLISTIKDTPYTTRIYGRENRICGNVILSDEIIGDKRCALYRKSKIVLVPLKENRESGQLTILHAMESGRPVIATNVDCMKDYIIDGYNGFLCPNSVEQWLEKINLLYSNELLYKELSKNCINMYSKKHTRKAMGINTGAAILEIL